METLGIATALLSVSSPGVYFGDEDAARRLARQVNVEGQRLHAARPGRFGFASTPLPDVEGAVLEASYALDEIGAFGICVESNHQGLYLGDAERNPSTRR